MSKRCMGCMELYGNEFEICPHCGYVEGTKAEEAFHMEPGTLLHDRYIIGKVLGYGGFGVTYIGWDGTLEQKVAIKEYLPSEFSTRMPGQSSIMVFNGEKSEQFRDGLNKFVEEAKRLAKFQNESGIVKVFDSFPENGTAYIIMEYLDGETLTDYLTKNAFIPENRAVNMIYPVLLSLEKLHENQIYHGTIEPDHFMLVPTGELKLFGFLSYGFFKEEAHTVLLEPSPYFAVERFGRQKESSREADIYAISATVYKMITGKTPRDALGRLSTKLSKKRRLVKPDLFTCAASTHITRKRRRAVRKAMELDEERRTPTIKKFLSDFSERKQ